MTTRTNWLERSFCELLDENVITQEKEKEGYSIPKLKFKFGGGDSSVSVSASPSKHDSKSEHGIPKL